MTSRGLAVSSHGWGQRIVSEIAAAPMNASRANQLVAVRLLPSKD